MKKKTLAGEKEKGENPLTYEDWIRMLGHTGEWRNQVLIHFQNLIKTLQDQNKLLEERNEILKDSEDE